MVDTRNRSIAARAGLVLGIAALVVTGGLLAGLRGGEGSPTTQAAPSAVRATLDPVTSLTGDAAQVSELQSRLKLHPANAQLQGSLGIAYLQRARETNDPSYYTKAQTLLGRSLKRDPAGLDATIGAGSLALSYHDFREALRLGQRALTLSHGFSPAALGMIGDASVELGRYRQGFEAFTRLGELRPGLVAYARLSYSRELVGDVDGATRLMREAVDAGSGAPENTQWTRVQLAALLLKSGHVDAAATEYRHALALLPGYARAEAGLGAVAVARGNLALAEQWYDRAASHLPLPDIVAQLGDVREARGDRAGAKEAYALVRLEQALFVRSGGNADLETALFEASHPGARSRASVVALARRALAFRPSIYGHDSLAWALYSAGKCREALPQAMLANRLGTIDPELSWHLGAIAACAGKHGVARTALQKALTRTPHFHPLDAPAARRLLKELA
jgi:tetratricopeptide (TPR) repeat protein